VVGVADMKISTDPADVVVTHALGSCLGIAVHDPAAQVGGLLHVTMPLSKINPAKARSCPFMFVDTGVPAFFQEIYRAGGLKSRLVVKIAGGANIHRGGGGDRFAIGKQNYVILKKLFWKNGILVDSEDVGGSKPRTMYLEIGTGRVWLSTAGAEKEL
jgi:chemotaxis protein CheD